MNVPNGNHPTPAALPPELAAHPRYRVLRELGRGGMGVVYQARQTVMDRQVVIKVISRSLLDRPDALERFRREVRAAAQLSHPNIVTAYDAEQAGDLHLLVMEFVPGQSLAEVLVKKGPLPVAHACHYARQAALGLQHAFERGMVHRDIKPANLMLTPKGQVKILDFGLAKMASERGPGKGLTSLHAYMGTPEYSAPEQAADAHSADIRADIYSLGCTLYCLLAGHPPFHGETDIQIILAHLQQEPVPLPELRPDVPATLWAVVARMLGKSAAQRYQRPVEVARALAPFCKPGAKAAPPGSVTVPPGAAGRGTVLPHDTSRLPGVARDAAARDAAARDEAAAPYADLAEAPAAPQMVKSARAAVKPRSAWPRWWAALAALAALAGVGAAAVALGLGVWLLAGKSAPVPAPLKPVPVAGRQPAEPPAAGPDKGKGTVGRAAAPVDANLRHAYKTRNGEWRIEGDELVQESLLMDCQLLFGDFTWKDFDFSCEAKKVGGNADVGLIYHATGAGSSEFNRGGANNTVDFVRSAEGGNLGVLTSRPGVMQTGRWYKLRVRLRGTHCECFLDDQLLFAYAETKNRRGAVGVRTWVAAARFRNLRVTDPAGRVLFEGLPELPAAARPW